MDGVSQTNPQCHTGYLFLILIKLTLLITVEIIVHIGHEIIINSTTTTIHPLLKLMVEF